MTASTVPALRSEQLKVRQLTIIKRRATAMLGAVTVVFLVVTVWGGDSTLAGYVQATAEASMVGGLADWFAVTALFRHPLGIPIPHTAIIVERKEQFGETLGEFIQETFLTRDVVDRADAQCRRRDAGGGLAVPTGQRRPAGAPRRSTARWPSPTWSATRTCTPPSTASCARGSRRRRWRRSRDARCDSRPQDGRHDEVLDAASCGDSTRTSTSTATSSGRGSRSRRRGGCPAPSRTASSIGCSTACASVRRRHGRTIRDHQLRRQLDERLAQLAADLETSPELRARGEQIKHDLLSQPELRAWTSSLWTRR